MPTPAQIADALSAVTDQQTFVQTEPVPSKGARPVLLAAKPLNMAWVVCRLKAIAGNKPKAMVGVE